MLNKPSKILFNTLILLLFTGYAYGQSGTAHDQKIMPADTNKDVAHPFRLGASYLSNSVFMGRTDSVVTPSVIAQVKYTLKSGFYFSGSLYYTPNKKTNKLDGGGITA